jgi:hypothetical protein
MFLPYFPLPDSIGKRNSKTSHDVLECHVFNGIELIRFVILSVFLCSVNTPQVFLGKNLLGIPVAVSMPPFPNGDRVCKI